jgi:hypothetical protein
MQHYGAPTRCLDWTESPYVAAYFAVATHWGLDGTVHIVHGYTLAQDWEQKWSSSLKSPNDIREMLRREDTPRAIIPFYSWRMHEREVAQQGRYTIQTNILDDVDASIPPILGKSQRRIVIPANLKPEFLAQLRGMNVTASALVPGLDGLGRSLTDSARLSMTEGSSMSVNQEDGTDGAQGRPPTGGSGVP